MKPDGKTDLWSSMSLACLGNRVSTQSLAFTLALSGMKCGLPLPSQHSPAETMMYFANLDLSTTRQFSSISRFFLADKTQSFWRLTGGFSLQVKVPFISDESFFTIVAGKRRISFGQR